ncbi:MAG: acyl--CoA ligase [Sphingomonadales bacterium]|nr:acyl--CoA ligase [Sphingomonadales bacterium]
MSADFQTLDGFIRYWANETPDAIAIRSERNGECITYRDLDLLIDHLCRRYEDRIGAGAICTLLMDDTIVCHAFLHVIFRLGAVVMPLDSELGGFLIDNMIRHAQPELILLAQDNKNVAGFTAVADPRVEIFDSRLAALADLPVGADIFATRADIDGLAMVAYTSGTTSDARGVLLTHRNLIAAYRSGTENMIRPTVVGCVFRIASLGTIGIHFFFAQYSGATTVLLPRLELRTLSTFWERHHAAQVDFVYIVPSLVKLLNHYGPQPPAPPRGIVVSAGSFLPPPQQEQFQDKFGACMLNIYGLTESSFAVFFGRQVDGRGCNDIGPARSLIAKVVDDQGNPVPDGTPGELWYSGEMVSTHGYLRNPEATAKTYRDGWLATGDIVVRDQDQNFTITGRKKDIIIRGGFNVYPSEVEDALLVEPAVVNAFVLGVDNAVLGEEILAYVQLKDGVAKDENGLIIQQVKKRLGVVKSPDRFFFTDREVPLNAAGKVDRRAVIASFEIG